MRYCPDRALPPYAFLPGKDPHPTRDPKGHSFGKPEPQAGYFPREKWSENSDYLFGIDLYNEGFLWEAHEAWEGLWHAAKHDVPQALFLQGLIQCSAACLKIPMQQPRGLARLSELGIEKLINASSETKGTYMGLDVLEFTGKLGAFAESQPDSIDARPRLELD